MNTKYRTQILAEDGQRWVDGAIFGRLKDAQRKLDEYDQKFRRPTRIVEVGVDGEHEVVTLDDIWESGL